MRCKFAVTFAVAVMAVAGSASAIEVTKSVEMDGTAADVWAKIGGWCGIGKWHPVVAKCEESKDSKGLHRTLTTKDGGVIKETQTKSEKSGYAYKIDDSPLPVSDYTASFGVADGKKGKVMVSWSAKFQEKKGTKPEEAKKVIEGVFTAGLDAIKGGK